MILQSYNFEVITPCFCGGAEPTQRAEIRPASIRGQLRWWFRVLGGFKSLPTQSIEKQEAMIFGSSAVDEGQAGLLTVRVKCTATSANYLSPRMQSAEGYFLFPLRDAPRHQIPSGQRFELQFLWRGSSQLVDDLAALATVFGSIGSLGFRARRAMGALYLHKPKSTLTEALARFNLANQNIRVFKLQDACNNSAASISSLAKWLKSWRMHGRTQDLSPGNDRGMPPENIGFQYAKNDHDIGYNILPATSPAYRPALGLPIIQKQNRWEWNRVNNKATGRFASPVILRPHRDNNGHWHALVVFVDALKWPDSKTVFINTTSRAVALDLYEAMKADAQLAPFL
jgi:CRISPR-associated protein Cmr1